MAKKNKVNINGSEYVQIRRVVGHKINAAGNEVPVSKLFYGKTKKEAEEKYKAYMNRTAAGLEGKKQYFGVMADNWIYNFYVNDSSNKDSTKNLYISAWNKNIKPLPFYNMQLDDVTALVIQNAYNTLKENGCPASTIKGIHKLMRKFYKYLECGGYARNITGSLVLPKDEKRVKDDVVVWTDEEIKTVLNSFEEAQDGFRLRFLLVLAYYTGCRISELLAVTYDDFTVDGLRINKQVANITTYSRNGEVQHQLGIDTTKTVNSCRVIPLNEAVMKELEIHRSWQRKDMMKNGYRTKYLFTTDSGGFYDKRNADRACRRYYKRIGVPEYGFHVYRHTFGTNLCRNGVPIQTASILLGHEDISTTAKYYINVSQEEKIRAVESLANIVGK